MSEVSNWLGDNVLHIGTKTAWEIKSRLHASSYYNMTFWQSIQVISYHESCLHAPYTFETTYQDTSMWTLQPPPTTCFENVKRFHACPIIISSCCSSHALQCPQITPRGPVSESQVYMTQRDMSSVGVPTINMWSTMLMNSLYNRSIYLQDWLSIFTKYIYNIIINIFSQFEVVVN